MNLPDDRPVVLDDLYDILARADRIVVTESPTADARILFDSTEKRDLEDLRTSLHLETPAELSHCMCIGTPALHVYERGATVLQLTNHHGLAVRCSLWTSDVPIADTEKWLSWFDERGIRGPRREFEHMTRQHAHEQRAWNDWVSAMPAPLRTVWDDALGQFGSVDVAPLRAALERDIPDERGRILALLEWFGWGAGSWSGYPSYESAAEELLLGYSTVSLAKTLESTKLSPAQREGAARLFAGWSFSQQRPRGMNEVPDALKKMLWAHVSAMEDEDKIARARQAFAE